MATFPIFSRRCRKSRFPCEISQFLNVGAKLFKTQSEPNSTHLCAKHSLQGQGTALGQKLPPLQEFGRWQEDCPFCLDGFGSLRCFWFSLSKVDEGLSVTVCL
jgi:hypothetical protein